MVCRAVEFSDIAVHSAQVVPEFIAPALEGGGHRAERPVQVGRINRCQNLLDRAEHVVGFHGHLATTDGVPVRDRCEPRSEEHTSELQSLMRTSYAVFCL